MTEITDEYMQQILSLSRDYTLVILRAGADRNKAGAEEIIWEHGRRNFLLRASGLLSIVCPVFEGGDTAGIGIFNANIDEVRAIMDEDPAVKEGVFVYEIYSCRGFPGDCLP